MESSKWHFIDYPKDEETCLLKMCDGEVALAEWDVDAERWLDLGHDRSWFTGGVACWIYVSDLAIPQTVKQMPSAR